MDYKSPYSDNFTYAQKQQTEELEEISRKLTAILWTLILILILSGCSAYAIYTRIGQMRLY